MEDVRRALMEGRCLVPGVGSVAAGRAADLPFVVMDADEREVEPVSAYLRDLALGDASRLNVPQLRVRPVEVAPAVVDVADTVGEGDRGRGGSAGGLAAAGSQSATPPPVAGFVPARFGEPQDRQASVASGLCPQDDQPRAHRDLGLLLVPLPLRGWPGAQPRARVSGAQAGAGAPLPARAGTGGPQGQVAAGRCRRRRRVRYPTTGGMKCSRR